MSSNTYPRYGCSFCKAVDATKELHKLHLDKFLSAVCSIKGSALLPAGNHFLPLLRAVRRRSARKGIYKTITLETSAYDVCCDWRLFDVITSDAELAAFFNRSPRSRAQWEKLATEFVDAQVDVDEPVSDRSTRDNYVPRWPTDDERRAASGDAGRAHGNANRNVQTTAQVQSAFGSPVKSKNGTFLVTVGGNKDSNTVRSLFNNGGEGSSKGAGKHSSYAHEDQSGHEDPGPRKKVRPSEKAKGKQTATATQDDLPEIIDLTTPVKQPPTKAPGYDVWTPGKPEPTMTIIVKGLGDRGIFEVQPTTTLAELVAEVEHRAGNTVLALKVKGGRPVDDELWNARVGACMTVAVEWDWSE